VTDGPLHDKRVLIVEDQYLIADDMRRAVLALGGLPVGPYANIEGAMMALEPPVDLALLDINLAGTEVYPLVDELLSRHTAVVFATGYDDSMIPERYKACGRLRKPVSRANLQSAVRAIFGG
jgi:DNA-binding NarL/FixJ family response regulator